VVSSIISCATTQLYRPSALSSAGELAAVTLLSLGKLLLAQGPQGVFMANTTPDELDHGVPGRRQTLAFSQVLQDTGTLVAPRP
jgi:hypothetical protein